MPEANMKPDQERVKNLLTDTVTLLCKNGLTFSNKLRIEGLLGVSIDDKDVFFVHISENFQNPVEPVEEETAESPVFTAPESPAKSSRRVRQSPSPSRTSSPAAFVKAEPGDDSDELLIVEEPKLEIFERSRTAGGQRRGRRKDQSPSQGWDDMGEPLAKRHMSTDEDENGSGYGDQGGWPDLSGVGEDYNQGGQVYQQDPGGSSFDSTSPGCSTWPMTLATQQQSQDSMDLTTRNFARNPASMITIENVRTTLVNHILSPLSAGTSKVLAFRMAWSSKSVPEDIIWQQFVAQSRQGFESDIMACEGISFFITSATATVSNQTNRRDICPALGCFVVSENIYFKEASLYIRLRNNPYGATLKLLNDRGVKPGEDRNLVWLSLLLKDNVDSGYVHGKLLQAGSHSKTSIVRLFAHSQQYRQQLLEAKKALEAEGFPIEIIFF